MESPETSKEKSLPEKVNSLDDKTQECFATLGDVMANIRPKYELIFSLTYAAGGWELSRQETKEVIDTLIKAGLVEAKKTIGDESFYTMSREAAAYARTMIIEDEFPV